MHLGAKLSGFDKPEAIREIRKKTVDVLKSIEKKLREEDYIGLIFTGDIFDSEQINYYWINSIYNIVQLVMQKGGFVIYATGNHDLFVTESMFPNLPKTGMFKVFNREKFEMVQINYKSQNYNIFGIGYESINPSLDISTILPKPREHDKNILVFHGEVLDSNSVNASKYLYSDINSISRRNYDYIAVGHTHNYKIIDKNIVYSGCTFPQGFDELGRKGAVSIDLDNNLNVEFINFSPYVLSRLELAVSSNDIDIISSEISRKVQEVEQRNQVETFFKIYVSTKGAYIDDFKRNIIEDNVFSSRKDKNSILFKAVLDEVKKEVLLPNILTETVRISAILLKEKLSKESEQNSEFFASNKDVVEILDKDYDNLVNDVFAVLQGEKYVD